MQRKRHPGRDWYYKFNVRGLSGLRKRDKIKKVSCIVTECVTININKVNNRQNGGNLTFKVFPS